MYNANQRQGSANSKGRGEVRGGGRKPYTQKKTGNARRGSTRSPLIVGGGVIFGPKGGRDWSKKMNKKEKRLAFERMLFERATDGTLELIDGIPVEEGKTKEMDSFLSKFPLDPPKNRPKYLVIDEVHSDAVTRAAANHPHVKLVASDLLNPYELLIAHKALITKQGLEGILKRLARTKDEDMKEDASDDETKEE
jgi:large subunit ribosomal protein L4